MDARILDILIGATGFLILLVLVIALPPACTALSLPVSAGYLAGIIGFILFMSGAGLYISRSPA